MPVSQRHSDFGPLVLPAVFDVPGRFYHWFLGLVMTGAFVAIAGGVHLLCCLCFVAALWQTTVLWNSNYQRRRSGEGKKEHNKVYKSYLYEKNKTQLK